MLDLSQGFRREQVDLRVAWHGQAAACHVRAFLCVVTFFASQVGGVDRRQGGHLI